jgi:hypothetical protein
VLKTKFYIGKTCPADIDVHDEGMLQQCNREMLQQYYREMLQQYYRETLQSHNR